MARLSRGFRGHVKLIIKGDRVIDGTSARSIPRAAVIVEDGRVASVVKQAELPEDLHSTEVIDTPGSTILPGLVETHAHMHCTGGDDVYDKVVSEDGQVLVMRAVNALRDALLSGVTTMRDLGSKNEVAFSVRQALQDGVIQGPRLLVTGTPITTTAGHCHMFGTEADTVDEVVTAVRRQVKLGADFIKVMSTGGNLTPRSNTRAAQYPMETLRAAVEDAKRLGVEVAAHCHGSVGVRRCVEAGVHHLIHCTWLSADTSKAYDYDPRVADLMAERGMYVDPTIALGELRRRADPDSELFKPGGGFAGLEERYEILRDMWDRGVRFIAGLDAGMPQGPFGAHAYVAQFMVELVGVSPMDAIVSATKTSAEALGVLDQTGTLEPGKAADVIVVDGDPLADISALHRVSTVVKGGTVFKLDGKALV